MKLPSSHLLCLALAASCAATASAADTAASTAKEKPIPVEPASRSTVSAEEAIKLDPFVISESDNVGYSANSTLAGTRINTALRDVGASISIITPEFLNDTASTNIGELLSLTTSTEVGGVFGNFAGGDQTSVRPDQSENRENPQGNQRVRGIGPATITRDYFITDIPFDSYNTSRVTMSRGPNSLLFGIGNPSGIIEASTSRPLLTRNRTEIGTRYGSKNSYRATTDINRVLVKDRFAFRIATVAEQNNFKQEPAFDRKKRGYGALELVLRDGKQGGILGKTTIRTSGEIGDSQSTPVNVIPPLNSIRNFFEAPDPSVDDIPGVILDPRMKRGTSTFTYVPKTTVDNRGNSADIVARYPGISVPYFIQIPLIYGTPGQSAPGYQNSNNPALANIAGIMGRVRYAQNPNLRPAVDMFYSNTTLWAGFVSPSLQDRRIFDYRNKLISGGLNRVEQTFQDGNIALTQELFNGHGGVEIAYDQQQTQSSRALPFSFGDNGGGSPASAISIDVSQYLPNDQPNPNVGRPFIQQQGIQDRIQDRIRESFRATAFYKLDLEDRGKKLFGIPLGNHTLTGLYNTQRADVFSQNYALGWASRTRNLNVDVFQAAVSGAFRTAPVIVQYLGPSVVGANSLSDVRITDTVTAKIPKEGDIYNVSFFDFTGKRLVTEPLSVMRFLNGASKTRQLIGSESVSLKSDFFKDTIVSVVGWRWDNLRTFSSEGNRRFADDSLDISGTRLRAAPDLDEKGRNFTWSLVGRVPRRFTKKLPLGIELGSFYNSSGNFNPVNVRTNLNGAIIPAPAGTTKEYGALIEFLDRRVSLRVNWFHTVQTNSSNNAQGATAQVYNFPTFIGDRYVVARNEGIAFNTIPGVTAAGYNSYDQLFAALFQILPEPTNKLKNLRFSSAGLLQSDSIQGLTDSSDLDARGMEAELVGNVTKRWRVSFNVAKQETVINGSARLTKQVADAVFANLVKFNLLGIDQGPALPERQTLGTRFAGNIGTPLAATTARDGAVSPEQRKWRANFVSTYDLRGFEHPIISKMSVGTAVRWQEKIAIGAPFLTGEALKQKILETDKRFTNTSQISNNDEVMQTQFPDLAHPFYGPDELAGDVWVAYRWPKIFKNVDMRMQLNVRNAWGNGEDIPVTANPDGSIAVIRIPNETRWLLSATFTF